MAAIQNKTNNNNVYIMQEHDHPSFQMCFKHGFHPIGDNLYIDTFIYESLGFNEPMPYVPELDDICVDVVSVSVEYLKDYFEEHGNLPGQVIQNRATWIVAWALEIVWCWDNKQLDNIEFAQDMSKFKIPLDIFKKLPEPWVNELVHYFTVWLYNNPGYTDRHQIDIYAPLSDGYLTMMRAVMAKMLPQF